MTVITFRWKMVLIPAIILAIILLMYKLPNAVGTLLAGFVFYLLLDPIVDRLNRKIKFRGLITMMVFLVILAIFACIIVLLNYLLTVEIPKFAASIPAFVGFAKMILANLDSHFVWLEKLMGVNTSGLFTSIVKNMFSQNTMAAFIANSTSIIMKLVSISFDFVMALIIAAYLIIDEQRILTFIGEHISRRLLLLNRQMWHEMLHSISGYIGGLLILGTILFLASWLFLGVMNIPYAFILSLWGGFTIIIPYVGPFIGVIPAVIVALTKGIWAGVTIGVFLAVLQFVVTSVIGPKILGEIIGVHPVIVIVALIAGGELGGMVGMVLAVPLTCVILIFLKYYWPMFIEN